MVGLRKDLSRLVKRVGRSIGLRSGTKADVERLYEEADYLEAYSRHTDLRVEQDPHDAVGGRWEEMGLLQFEFLRDEGLEPRHRLLDIGCGTLRGGRHFIRYLMAGRYTGTDISSGAIDFARRLVEDEGLAHKRPELRVSEDRDLRFREFRGRTFDFLLAQSVFTHLKAEHIEECFEHVGAIMHPASRFYFTHYSGETVEQTTKKHFLFPFSFFEELGQRHGLRVEDLADRYPHPLGQRMVCARRA